MLYRRRESLSILVTCQCYSYPRNVTPLRLTDLYIGARLFYTTPIENNASDRRVAPSLWQFSLCITRTSYFQKIYSFVCVCVCVSPQSERGRFRRGGNLRNRVTTSKLLNVSTPKRSGLYFKNKKENCFSRRHLPFNPLSIPPLFF